MQNKGISATSIYKDEFLRYKSKSLKHQSSKATLQLDNKINKLRWELFEDDAYLMDDDFYNSGVLNYDYKNLVKHNAHKKPLLNSNSGNKPNMKKVLKQNSSM